MSSTSWWSASGKAPSCSVARPTSANGFRGKDDCVGVVGVGFLPGAANGFDPDRRLEARAAGQWRGGGALGRLETSLRTNRERPPRVSEVRNDPGLRPEDTSMPMIDVYAPTDLFPVSAD